MMRSGRVFILAAACGWALAGPTTAARADELLPELARYVEQRVDEFAQIPPERRQTLEQLAQYIHQSTAQQRTAELTFICTHNSRRSHLSQVWARVAAAHYGIQPVRTYSGGTEVTAFNPRAVAALRRCGLSISTEDRGANPHYQVRFSPTAAAEICFSKTFDSPPNPAAGFAAVMTCSDADDACPTVPGAELRVAIRYDDPKIADDTPQEAERYDERSRQIAREMLYTFSRVAPADEVPLRKGG